MFSGGDPNAPADAARVSLAGPVTQLRVSGKQSCALLEDGAVWCWGEDNDRCTDPSRAGDRIDAQVVNGRLGDDIDLSRCT